MMKKRNFRIMRRKNTHDSFLLIKGWCCLLGMVQRYAVKQFDGLLNPYCTSCGAGGWCPQSWSIVGATHVFQEFSTRECLRQTSRLGDDRPIWAWDLRKSTVSMILCHASFWSVHARQCLNGSSGRGWLRSSQLLLRWRTKQAGKGIDMPPATSPKGLHAFWTTLSLRPMFANASKTEGVRSFSAAQDASRVGVTNHHSAIHLDEMEGDWMGWPEATFLPLASVLVDCCWAAGLSVW